MLTAAAVLRPSSGRFWDSESESECEDLGDAEAHHPTVSSSPAPTQGAPAVVAPSATVLPLARGSATPPRRSPSTPPRRAKPPWKSLWKGPLPPARSSSPATLGDFLPPALRTAEGRGDAAAWITDHDPFLPLVPNLERAGRGVPATVHHLDHDLIDLQSKSCPVPPRGVPGVCPGPPYRKQPGSGSLFSTGPSRAPPPGDSATSPSAPPSTPPAPAPVPPPGRRRRLVNTTVPLHLLSTTPYRDALMAGRGRFRRRGLEGRGAAAHQTAGDRTDQVRGRGVPRVWGGCPTFG
jgi:hypothetical protein